MPAHELVVDALRDVGAVKASASCASTAWNTTWNRRSPSSSASAARGVDRVVVGRVGRQRLDRVDHLVGLFEQVAREGVVGLLGVPRAATGAAEAAPEREQRAEDVSPRPGRGRRTAP